MISRAHGGGEPPGKPGPAQATFVCSLDAELARAAIRGTVQVAFHPTPREVGESRRSGPNANPATCHGEATG